MIAGTDFFIVELDHVWHAAWAHAARWVTPDALDQSARPNAVCLASPDGAVSIALEPAGGGRMRAFVLAAISTSGPGAFKRNEPAMVAIARDMGAEVLGFRSVRKGWARVLGPEWSQDGEIFQRSI